MTHPIPGPAMIVLYVADAAASARFYETLFGVTAERSSPGFSTVPLPGGLTLGLWKVGAVAPATSLCGGGSELVLPLPSAAAVDALCETFRTRGATIAQMPQAMDFGHNFLALDPDGHRIRCFCPGAAG